MNIDGDELNEEELAFFLREAHNGNPRHLKRRLSEYLVPWPLAVELVEAGFDRDNVSWEAFLNARSSLNHLRLIAPESLRRRLDAAHSPLDARFYAATWSVGEVHHSWDNRLPNKILPKLMADLRPEYDQFLRERGYI